MGQGGPIGPQRVGERRLSGGQCDLRGQRQRPAGDHRLGGAGGQADRDGRRQADHQRAVLGAGGQRQQPGPEVAAAVQVQAEPRHHGEAERAEIRSGRGTHVHAGAVGADRDGELRGRSGRRQPGDPRCHGRAVQPPAGGQFEPTLAGREVHPPADQPGAGRVQGSRQPGDQGEQIDHGLGQPGAAGGGDAVEPGSGQHRGETRGMRLESAGRVVEVQVTGRGQGVADPVGVRGGDRGEGVVEQLRQQPGGGAAQRRSQAAEVRKDRDRVGRGVTLRSEHQAQAGPAGPEGDPELIPDAAAQRDVQGERARRADVQQRIDLERDGQPEHSLDRRAGSQPQGQRAGRAGARGGADAEPAWQLDTRAGGQPDRRIERAQQPGDGGEIQPSAGGSGARAAAAAEQPGQQLARGVHQLAQPAGVQPGHDLPEHRAEHTGGQHIRQRRAELGAELSRGGRGQQGQPVHERVRVQRHRARGRAVPERDRGQVGREVSLRGEVRQ